MQTAVTETPQETALLKGFTRQVEAFRCVYSYNIDGFSQKIICSNDSKTSSNPRVIGAYFAEALETQMQRHLRTNHGDNLSGEI